MTALDPTAILSGDTPPGFHSGFVALCGRPNVGKSTLLNAMLGEDLAVTTRFPQTTRERLLGIWTRPAFQAVLVDTPGIHRPRSALNRYMVDQAMRAARDVDIIVLLAEVPILADAEAAEAWVPGPVAEEALSALAELGRPIVLALTKVDRLKDRALLLPVIQGWQERHEFSGVVPVSGVTREGLEQLESEILAGLPEGPALYDGDQLSDRNLRWHTRELIRGELFHRLSEELPYSCAVTVSSFVSGKSSDQVRASIHVERESQKGIVIGKGARTIKGISSAARERIAGLTERPCELFLDVRVTKNWTKDPTLLERLGYEEDAGKGGRRS